MNDIENIADEMPPEQQAIRAKCFHPSGVFTPFCKTDIEPSVTDRFEEIVRKYPNRIAIETTTQKITYDALNQIANRVARAILFRRGDTNEPIALLLEQSAESIAAILATLKAGKMYVPLDPASSLARLTAILEDSCARLLLCDNANRSLGNTLASAHCSSLCIDDVGVALSAQNPSLSVSADSLAAIFYTSGSTGQPKGVIQSQRNILHRVMIDTNNFHICPDDRLSLFSSPTFSVSSRNLFGALLNGAAVYPFNIKDESLNQIAARLDKEKITIYFSVPTVFRQMTEYLTEQENLSTVRLIYLGGESVSTKDVELYKTYFSPNCIFVHSLAMTEAGLIRQYYLDKMTEIDGPLVPAGYSVDDKDVLLLDDTRHEVRSGEVGEIAVRSRYLSPGYWRRPDVTETVFCSNLQVEDQRIYLTGDIGRMRPDGCLEYLGRKDSRVKIRGIGIELREIEMALLEHHALKEAVVMPRNVSCEEQQLVAFVVAAQQPPPTTSELRIHLEQKLPSHMVPSRFIFLDSLPLTPNGKVDRQALPQPGDERPELESVFVAPQDGLQRELVKIWEGVLGVRAIGIRDSFFDLGGHSLLSVKLMAEIEETFTTRLAPATLFQAPTIEQLGDIIRRGSQSWSSLVTLQSGGTKTPFFWIHGDYSNAYLPRYLGPEQPLYGLDHQSQDGKPARYTSVETIATHYLREIRTVQAQGPYYLGGYSFGSIVAFEIAQQLKSQDQKVALLVLLDPPRPLSGTSKSSSTALSGKRTIIDRFHNFIRRHYVNLAALGYKGKLLYLFERGMWRLTDARESVSGIVAGRSLKRALVKVCLAQGRDLPPSVRSLYIMGIYDRARKKYEMRPYSGRVVLFKGGDRSDDYVGEWEPYLVGEKEFYEVPGNHSQLREEPYIHIWAEKLKASLEAAQVSDTSAGSFVSSSHLESTTCPNRE